MRLAGCRVYAIVDFSLEVVQCMMCFMAARIFTLYFVFGSVFGSKGGNQCWGISQQIAYTILSRESPMPLLFQIHEGLEAPLYMTKTIKAL